jgi:hypothetical protein
LSSSSVLCTKCCQFLWIVHSCLPLSFVCLRPVSCVPNVSTFSGLSIIACSSVFEDKQNWGAIKNGQSRDTVNKR